MNSQLVLFIITLSHLCPCSTNGLIKWYKTPLNPHTHKKITNKHTFVLKYIKKTYLSLYITTQLKQISFTS